MPTPTIFLDNIESHPRFRDTLGWWSGPWFPKVPYYRPATMTLFWAERHAFGPQGRPAFQWTHRLLHLGFLSLLLAFFGSCGGLEARHAGRDAFRGRGQRPFFAARWRRRFQLLGKTSAM